MRSDVREVFESYGRGPARSFPAMLPMLHLDRIYVRGFRVKLAHVHHGVHWARFSDHAALSAFLTPRNESADDAAAEQSSPVGRALR